MVKRAVFMFSIMFPILVVLEYTGNSSMVFTVTTAAILAGISTVVFPDQPSAKNAKDSVKAAEKKQEQPDKDKKNEQPQK